MKKGKNNTSAIYAHRFPVGELEKSIEGFYKKLSNSGMLDLIQEAMKPPKKERKKFHDNVRSIIEKEKLDAEPEEEETVPVELDE